MSASPEQPRPRLARRIARALDPRGFFLAGVARRRTFRALWLGQGISQVGSQVSFVALPLVAALFVHVSPAEMGVLAALETFPALLFTIPSGVLSDKVDRRRLLIVTDLARAAAIALVPLAYVAGFLGFGLLALVAFIMGSLTIVFDVTYDGYLPEVIDPNELIEGNQRLEITASAARIAGPGLGTLIVGITGAGLTVIADAASYLVSAVSLMFVSTRPEFVRPCAHARPDDGRSRLRSAIEAGREEFTSGMRIVLRDRVLRDLAIVTSFQNLGNGIAIALVVLLATGKLGMSAADYGLVYTITSCGFILGAVSVRRLSDRLGTGKAMALANAAIIFVFVALPLSGPGLGIVWLIIARFAMAASNAVWNPLIASVRQHRADPAYRSRITGAFRLITWGTLPVGSLLAGAVATIIGIESTLWIACVMPIAAAFILRFGPAWSVRLPDTSHVGVAV